MTAPESAPIRATALAVADQALAHRIDIRQHRLLADEPVEVGGDDDGPTPQELLAASLAACTSITMQMYARRKGWEIGPVEVECEYDPPEKGAPTNFRLIIRLPRGCSEDQVERLRVIATKCPVHRTLAGEVTFDERIELVPPQPTGT
jgi:putative redox protein